MDNSQQSIVARWNEAMLEAIREGGASPTPTSHRLYLVSSAIYDAYTAYDPAADGHFATLTRPTAEATEANLTEAVSTAAHRILSALFPDGTDAFDALMTELGLPIDGSGTSAAAQVGRAAADAALAAALEDGSNIQNDYADTSGYQPVNAADPDDAAAPGGADFDANRWQPLRVPNGAAVDADGVPTATADPASFDDQQALTPHWGGVTPFALASGDAARPQAPPQLGDFSPYVDALGQVTTGDQAYRDQFGAVLQFSADLTDRQKAIAEFWADGPRTESPPGHWNQIAQDLALRDEHGIEEDAKMFFALNAAIFDASIATWDAKYAYDFVRPQSAIRDLFFDQEVQAWGGPNQGTQRIQGQDWRPYQNVTFVTPPFPEYTSGHSGFSAAAATVLESFTGTGAFYDGATLGNYDLDGDGAIDLLGEFNAQGLSFEDYDGPPITLRWETLREAADEAGISRLFGGIHIQDGDLFGREIGDAVGSLAWTRSEALFTRGGDDRLLAEVEGGLLLAGGGDDRVLGRAGDDLVEAGAGDDRVSTARGDDSLWGESGDDTLKGGGGRDRIEGGEGDDWLFGGLGADRIAGGRDDDWLFGGRGADRLIGGAGHDGLFGNRDSDTLRGGDGDDTLNGGPGDDLLWGGRGADQFRFSWAFGQDEILDFEVGVDQIAVRDPALTSSASVALSQVGADAMFAFSGGRSVMVLDQDASALSVDDIVFL